MVSAGVAVLPEGLGSVIVEYPYGGSQPPRAPVPRNPAPSLASGGSRHTGGKTPIYMKFFIYIYIF